MSTNDKRHELNLTVQYFFLFTCVQTPRPCIQDFVLLVNKAKVYKFVTHDAHADRQARCDLVLVINISLYVKQSTLLTDGPALAVFCIYVYIFCLYVCLFFKSHFSPWLVSL